MSEYKAISTAAELETLNSIEALDGYLSGLRNDPEPGSDKSKSFWHGWRNGMADKGRIPIDSAMRNLAEEIVRISKAH